MEINKVKRRLLFLSPSVASNSERECNVGDFQSLSRKAIGEGAFGQVFKVRHISTGSLYAIKAVSKGKILERNMVEQLKREIRIMYTLNHPNIIKLHNHFEDDNNVYLIMELAEGGNLFQKLCKFKNFDERTAAQYLREVALAVQYLHTQDPPIIHRDIKPENIFLDSQGRSKLGDFGWSSVYDSERCTYCGTLEYLAPEMIDRIGHGLKLDMWNLGVLLFELLVGEAPFRSKSQTELFKKIKDCKIGFPKNFSLNAKDLVRKLLKTTAEDRICVEEVLEHRWMKENPPLRPTIAVAREVRKAPAVPETPVVVIPDTEYLVISDGTLQGKLKRVNEELAAKQEILDTLMAKISKINEVKSARSPKKEENVEKNAKAKRELERLAREYANYKQVLSSKNNGYAVQATKLQIQSNCLNGLKTFSKVLKWVSDKSKLSNYVTDTREILTMVKEPNFHPVLNAVSQSMRDSLLLKSELERVYNSTYQELEKRNKDIAQMESDLAEIRTVLLLKKDVYSALGFKII